MEGLAHETLHLSGAFYGYLILGGKLVHSEDGDYILKLAVSAEYPLRFHRNSIMPLADDIRLHQLRGGFERVDRGIDAQLDDLS